MLVRTHLAIGLLVILAFISYSSHAILFACIVLFATILPDIDTPLSVIGRKKLSRLINFFTKHRGFLHSFTFLLLITILFSLFIPQIAFAFFVGYSFHLFADCFTVQGIAPFWPFKKKVSGKIEAGGHFETSLFFFFLILDVIFIGIKFASLA
ncbi:LexA-binding, inner membrane-associated putative hydrolase [uncultured archaeon]|nr:LexA-binding, inner membrane-associated putative hydrolase [uncultured archaeon]